MCLVIPPVYFHPFLKTETAKESLKTRWGVTLTKARIKKKTER